MFNEVAVSAQSAQSAESASKVEYSEILVMLDAVYTAIANFNSKCSEEALRAEQLTSDKIIKDRAVLATAITNQIMEIDEHKRNLIAKGIKLPNKSLYNEEIRMITDEWNRASQDFEKVAWKLYCCNDIAGYSLARQALEECFDFELEVKYKAKNVDREAQEESEGDDAMEGDLQESLEDPDGMQLD